MYKAHHKRLNRKYTIPFLSPFFNQPSRRTGTHSHTTSTINTFSCSYHDRQHNHHITPATNTNKYQPLLFTPYILNSTQLELPNKQCKQALYYLVKFQTQPSYPIRSRPASKPDRSPLLLLLLVPEPNTPQKEQPSETKRKTNNQSQKNR